MSGKSRLEGRRVPPLAWSSLTWMWDGRRGQEYVGRYALSLILEVRRYSRWGKEKKDQGTQDRHRNRDRAGKKSVHWEWRCKKMWMTLIKNTLFAMFFQHSDALTSKT